MSELDPYSTYIWTELDNIPPFEERIVNAIEEWGINLEAEQRLLDRGFIVHGFHFSQRVPHFDCIEDTPAHRFNQLLHTNDGSSIEEKLHQLLKVLQDAIAAEDEDDFRANWPELY